MPCKERLEQRRIRNVAPHESPAATGLLRRERFNLPQAMFLERHIVIIIHAVHAHNPHVVNAS